MRSGTKLKKYKPGSYFRPIGFNNLGYSTLVDSKTYIKKNDICILLDIKNEKINEYPSHFKPVIIYLYSFLNGVLFKYCDEANNCDFIQNFKEIKEFGE